MGGGGRKGGKKEERITHEHESGNFLDRERKIFNKSFPIALRRTGTHWHLDLAVLAFGTVNAS